MKKLLLLLACAYTLTASAQGNLPYLKFTSIQQYEQLIASGSLANVSLIPGASSYQSLKSTFPADPTPPAELNDELADDGYDVSEDAPPSVDPKETSLYLFLANILNVDGVVMIGDWAVKVDYNAEKAYLLKEDAQFAANYPDLVAGNVSNPKVMEFSTEDEGLEVMQLLDQGEPLARIKLWCKDRYAKSNRDADHAYAGNRHRLDMKVVYQRAFLVFSLEGKAHTQRRFLRIWWRDGKGTASMSRIELDYKPRCKSPFSHWGDPSTLSGYEGGSSTTKYEAWFSTKALRNYRYAIDFQSSHGNGHVEIEDN